MGQGRIANSYNKLLRVLDGSVTHLYASDFGDITSIKPYAFNQCTALVSVVMPDAITGMSVYVFWGCTSLQSIKLSNNLTSIAGFTLGTCTSLTSIIIPALVTSIDTAAFSGCSSLSTITVLATTPPTLSSNAFNSSGITASAGTIYVPAGTLSAYQAATNWSTYAARMVESGN